VLEHRLRLRRGALHAELDLARGGELSIPRITVDGHRERLEGPFDLVLCRNLAFTCFDEDLQRETLSRITETMTD